MKEKSPSQSRRHFFRSFLTGMSTLSDEARGIPQMPLKKLHLLPDDQIKKMVPVFFDDSAYHIQDEQLIHYDKKTKVCGKVCDLGEQEVFMLNHFNSDATIETIASLLSAQFNLRQDSAFQSAKTFFLYLAEKMICHPKEAHEDVRDLNQK
jgi:hypothetical protein